MLLLGPRRLEWVAETLEAPGAGQVLVQTTAGSISIGSELPLYMGRARSSTPPTYPVGVECSNRNAGFTLLQQQMLPDGRICVLSDGNVEPLVLAPAFHEKELRVVGSSDGWDYQAHARWYFDVIRQSSAPLAQLFDYHTSAAGLPDTFARLAAGAISPVKVLVSYHREDNANDQLNPPRLLNAER